MNFCHWNRLGSFSKSPSNRKWRVQQRLFTKEITSWCLFCEQRWHIVILFLDSWWTYVLLIISGNLDRMVFWRCTLYMYWSFFKENRCQFRIRLIQEKTFPKESISPYHSRYSWKHKIETIPRTNISSFWLVGWDLYSENHPFSHIFMHFLSLTYRLKSVRPPTRPLLGCSKRLHQRDSQRAGEVTRWEVDRLS